MCWTFQMTISEMTPNWCACWRRVSLRSYRVESSAARADAMWPRTIARALCVLECGKRSSATPLSTKRFHTAHLVTQTKSTYFRQPSLSGSLLKQFTSIASFKAVSRPQGRPLPLHLSPRRKARAMSPARDDTPRQRSGWLQNHPISRYSPSPFGAAFPAFSPRNFTGFS
jgi:hypothetical protein